MAIQFLRLDQATSIRDLPDMTGVDLSQPLNPGQPEAPVIPPERTDYPALWLDSATVRNARAIYARGQRQAA